MIEQYRLAMPDWRFLVAAIVDGDRLHAFEMALKERGARPVGPRCLAIPPGLLTGEDLVVALPALQAGDCLYLFDPSTASPGPVLFVPPRKDGTQAQGN